LYTVAYLKLPLEAGYLIPLVPFAIILLCFLMQGISVIVFSLLLMLSPFLSCNASGLPNLQGPVITDYTARAQANTALTRVIDAVAHLPARSIVVAGTHMPAVQTALGSDTQGQHRYIYLFKDVDEYNRYAQDGYAVYFVDRATERYQALVNGLQLRKHGAHLLPRLDSSQTQLGGQ
jgi:hypothetical protein